MSESKLPIIVVCSEGARSSQEIINSKSLSLAILYIFRCVTRSNSVIVTGFTIINDIIRFCKPFSCVDLRKNTPDKNTVDLGDGVTGFKFHNVTKYYENDIVFLSHESKHPSSLPFALLDRIEGLIVYFDSDNVSI